MGNTADPNPAIANGGAIFDLYSVISIKGSVDKPYLKSEAGSPEVSLLDFAPGVIFATWYRGWL